MTKNSTLLRLIGAASVVALLGTMPVHAQQTNTDAAAATAEARVSSGDRALIDEIAEAHIAEIEASKLALEKSQNEKIRTFAQAMIDDHTQSLEALRTLAQSKGITLPTEPDIPHKTLVLALKVLSGSTFDSQYLARVGVGDHERAEQLLEQTINETSDFDLKDYAKNAIVTVRQHLSAARAMDTDK